MIKIGNLPVKQDIEEPIEHGDTIYFFNETLANLDPFLMLRHWKSEIIDDSKYDTLLDYGCAEWLDVVVQIHGIRIADWFPSNVIVRRYLNPAW